MAGDRSNNGTMRGYDYGHDQDTNPPRPSSSSDEYIAGDINEALARNPFLDATQIEVCVVEGRATLGGTVESRTAKHLAGEIADSIQGVLDVHNRLQIGGAAGAPDPDPIAAPTL